MDDAVICPSCNHRNRLGARFCDECGARLAAPASQQAASPAGEEDRRLVTVLFCDLVGFTTLSETLDAEDIREIQDGYFAAMSAEITRFGGTVEKYAGDAVLAIFGAPVVHEDDPERAIRCALAMHEALKPLAEPVRRRWDLSLALRIGVNSGEVVSGLRSTAGRVDYAVTGDTVNTAARFQTAAPPGGVMVGEETMKLARRDILFGPRQDLVLKGKAEPVAAYPVLRIRERTAERWETAERVSPLVGRRVELTLLVEAWNRARTGDGQMVAVIAEAGLGKSRLVTEALERMEMEDAWIVRARCFSYSQASSLSLVAELIGDLIGVRPGDPPGEIHWRTAAVRHLLPEGEEGDSGLALIETVLGVPDLPLVPIYADPQVRRAALIQTVGSLIAGTSRETPLVVVLEDVHWIDAASEDVLGEVLMGARELPMLVISTQRPDRDVWSIGWSWIRRLELQPLSESEAAALARGALAHSPLSPDLERQIHERAGGNPFFTEELLRSLEESGDLDERDGVVYLASDAGERLPSTLTEVLLARLDRLDRSVRSLTQVASVIGRIFAVRLLSQVMDQEAARLEGPLRALHDALIALPRVGFELEYVFRHAMIRDAAYNTILLRRRRALHGEIARLLSTMRSGDEIVDLIAYHFGRSEEHAEAALWLERSGDRAAALYANETARDRYQEARGHLDQMESDSLHVARLDEKIGGVLRTLGSYDDALAVLEQAAALYGRAGEQEARGRTAALIGEVHHGRGSLLEGIARVEPVLEGQGESRTESAVALRIALVHSYGTLGRTNDALACAEEAANIARFLGDDRLIARSDMLRASLLRRVDGSEKVLPLVQEAMVRAQRCGDLRTLAEALQVQISFREEAGELRAAVPYADQALAIAEKIGDPAGIAETLQDRGRLAYRLGDWRTAREAMARAVPLMRSIGASSTLPNMLYAEGAVATFQGDFELGRASLEEAIALATEIGVPAIVTWANRFIAEGEILTGRPDDARDGLEALVATHGPEQTRLTMWTLPALAWAYAEVGDVRRARETADRALAEARDRGDQVVLPDALWVAGSIAARDGRPEESERLFEEGLVVSTEIEALWPQSRTLYEYGLLLAQEGRIGEARARLEEALAVFRMLEARPYIERAEAALRALTGELESIDDDRCL